MIKTIFQKLKCRLLFLLLIAIFTANAQQTTGGGFESETHVIKLGPQALDSICFGRSPRHWSDPFYTIFFKRNGQIFYQDYRFRKTDDTAPRTGSFKAKISKQTFIQLSNLIWESDFFNQTGSSRFMDSPSIIIEAVTTELVTKTFVAGMPEIEERKGIKLIVGAIDKLKSEIVWIPIEGRSLDDRIIISDIGRWCRLDNTHQPDR
jgi:hypothetical protein